jgi:hypothetical protein
MRKRERYGCQCEHGSCHDFSNNKRKRVCCDALNHCIAKLKCFGN